MKKHSCLLLIALVLISNACQVKIPANDSIKPTTEIQVILEQKVLYTYKTGDKQLVLFLDPDKIYDLLINGRDKGGVAKVRSEIKGITFKGDVETVAPRSNARDRRLLNQALDSMSNGDYVTISTLVEDFNGNQDRSNEPQIVINVGRVTPTVNLSSDKTEYQEGETVKLSWTTSKAKSIRFTNPLNNNLPTGPTARGSVDFPATLGQNNFVLSATSHTGTVSTSSHAFNVLPVPKCYVERKSDKRIEMKELGSGRIKEVHQLPNVPTDVFKLGPITHINKEYAASSRTNKVVPNKGIAGITIYDLINCKRFNMVRPAVARPGFQFEYRAMTFGRDNWLIAVGHMIPSIGAQLPRDNQLIVHGVAIKPGNFNPVVNTSVSLGTGTNLFTGFQGGLVLNRAGTKVAVITQRKKNNNPSDPYMIYQIFLYTINQFGQLSRPTASASYGSGVNQKFTDLEVVLSNDQFKLTGLNRPNGRFPLVPFSIK